MLIMIDYDSIISLIFKLLILTFCMSSSESTGVLNTSFTKLKHLGYYNNVYLPFDPWIRDPGWVKNQDPDPGVDILDHISESLKTIFWVKNA
jgi:hypothetical protein